MYLQVYLYTLLNVCIDVSIFLPAFALFYTNLKLHYITNTNPFSHTYTHKHKYIFTFKLFSLVVARNDLERFRQV